METWTIIGIILVGLAVLGQLVAFAIGYGSFTQRQKNLIERVEAEQKLWLEYVKKEEKKWAEWQQLQEQIKHNRGIMPDCLKLFDDVRDRLNSIEGKAELVINYITGQQKKE